jgi:hypothetical protein
MNFSANCRASSARSRYCVASSDMWAALLAAPPKRVPRKKNTKFKFGKLICGFQTGATRVGNRPVPQRTLGKADYDAQALQDLR